MLKILHITSSFMPPKSEGDMKHSQFINNEEGEYRGARVGGISAIVDSMNKNCQTNLWFITWNTEIL